MGMFDYIQVEKTLPELPQEIISRWGDEAYDITFQTKDTPNQAMSYYKIDDAGLLWVKKIEGRWEKGKEVADDAPFGEKMAAMGYFVVEHEWWEEEKYTGAINFYESYNHPEYKSSDKDSDSDDWRRFEIGWVEYCALFKDGKLIEDIQLTNHTAPKKLSDEEFALSQEKALEARKQMHKKLREDRKKFPSAEQKLIDNIDRECKLAENIMDETDMSYALSNIRILIGDYRKNIDRWYEE